MPAELLNLAQRGPHDIGAERRQDPHRGLGVEAEPVERPDQPLGVARVVGAGRRAGVDEIDRPRVAQQRRPGVARVGRQVRSPVSRWRRRLDLRLHRVEHELVQFFLGLDVPVERHRADPQVAGDPPHADGLGPLGVGDGDRDVDDVRPAEPAHPARRARRAPARASHCFCCLLIRSAIMPLVVPLPPVARAERPARVEEAQRQEELLVFLVVAHESSLSATAAPVIRFASRTPYCYRTAYANSTRTITLGRRHERRARHQGGRAGQALRQDEGPGRARPHRARPAPSTACSARTGRARPPPSACWRRCCARTAGRRASSAATWSPTPPQVRRTIGLTGQYAALDEYLTGRANLIMIGQLSRLTARAAKAAGGRAARAVRPDRRGDPGGQDLLGRHAPPARPGGLADRPAGGAVPGRADDRSRPERPRADVGHRPRSWSRTAPRCCSPPSTWTRRTCWPAGSPSSTAARSSPRGPRPSSRRPSAASGC